MEEVGKRVPEWLKFSREIGKRSHFFWEKAVVSMEGSVFVEQMKKGTIACLFVTEICSTHC